MTNRHIPPILREPFRNEGAMAMLRLGLAAKQTTAMRRKDRFVEYGRHVFLVHLRVEASLELLPILAFSIPGEQVVVRRKHRQVQIFSADQLLHEEGEIRFLGESGQLPLWTPPDIDQYVDLVLPQEPEKSLGGFLRETDGVKLDHFRPNSC